MKIAIAFLLILSGCGDDIPAVCPSPPDVVSNAILWQSAITEYVYPTEPCSCDWSMAPKPEFAPVLTSFGPGNDDCVYVFQATQTCGTCTRIIDVTFRRGDVNRDSGKGTT